MNINEIKKYKKKTKILHTFKTVIVNLINEFFFKTYISKMIIQSVPQRVTCFRLETFQPFCLMDVTLSVDSVPERGVLNVANNFVQCLTDELYTSSNFCIMVTC